MKGKLAFILGAAVGYVLGTRAGRERYEQIKRGAQRVWETEPVQRGVHLVKGAVDERAEELKALALRFGGDVVDNLVKGRPRGGSPAGCAQSRSDADSSDAGSGESRVGESKAGKSRAGESKAGGAGSSETEPEQPKAAKPKPKTAKAKPSGSASGSSKAGS